MKRKHIKSAIAIIIFYLMALNVLAREGMWLPMLLGGALESEMKSMGMNLSAEDIYSINKSSLKDAIVNFGGCTASMISPDGLLLTNHHCAYSHIQSHSSVGNDLLTNGFRAKSRQEELPNPNLRIYFIKRIEDVSKTVLRGIDDQMDEKKRQQLITVRIDSLKKLAIGNSHYDAIIRPFYYGNEYYMFIVEVFSDVRLVGAPPSSIGKFGGDTDNWMWPRHTGDFAIYRVYTDKEGKPADYHKENIPYNPERYLPVNVAGVASGEFTMIFGFPGRTTEYLASPAVDFLVNVLNPHRIRIRDTKLGILQNAMSKNDTLRIKYSAKHARTANAYKKWIGETMGLKNFDAIQKKKELEKDFLDWCKQDKQRETRYGSILDEFALIYKAQETNYLVSTYMDEAAYGIDAFALASYLSRLVDAKKIPANEEYAAIESINNFYKDFDKDTDKQLFAELMDLYVRNVPQEYIPKKLRTVKNKFSGSMEAYAEGLYHSSLIMNEDALVSSLSSTKSMDFIKKLAGDPFIVLFRQFEKLKADEINPGMRSATDQLEILYRTYMRALMEMQENRTFYPDANGTMRISFGVAEGCKPRDGIQYLVFTTLDGVMQKADTANPEFFVPEKLKQLHRERDYGIYGRNDTLYVCFLASNHTTGGNSGSPIIDAYGNLIGLNFDRTWESTMSDVMYDPSICRNISVDVRYILFIIDKFAGAGYLLDEMTLVGIEQEAEIEN